MRSTVGRAVALCVVAVLALLAWGWARRHPQDLPWTPLDLAQPVGLFSGRKLAALTGDFPACRAALDRAGVRYTVLAPLSAKEGRCGYADGLRFAAGGSRTIDYQPPRLGWRARSPRRWRSGSGR